MSKTIPRATKDGLVEYQYSDKFKVTQEVKDVFKQDGAFLVSHFVYNKETQPNAGSEYKWDYQLQYILYYLNMPGGQDLRSRRNLLSKEEISVLLKALEGNEILDKAWELPDGKGKAARMLLWNHPGDDITGMVGRCNKVVDICEQVMGGEVYHYHSKLMMKEAKFGGKLNWHQDFGYWYKNGCLKPDMLTVFIPLDKCTRQNGCLQMIPRTHLCGRIEHNMIAGQTVTNQERVDLILGQKEEFPLLHLEMEPGDAAVFHCNVLHQSDPNESNSRRWAFVMAYNMASNNPVLEHHHPLYTPIEKVDNDSILMCKNYTDFTGKDIMDPSMDKTVKATLISSNYH